MFKRIKDGLKRFFFPPESSSRWMFVLPYLVLGILAVVVLVGGAYGWEYTNSSKFCGTTCHTMPPQYSTYNDSPHANVACVECHIGRAFVGNLIARKSQDVREIVSMTFSTYEYPIQATRLRPARDTCETCHLPEQFSDDSLRTINHFQDDVENTATSTSLILKTGGGSKRQGQGLGIHWHITNKVEYYATDPLSQTIPYVRVYNDDGTTTEFIDVESGFDPATMDQSQLKTMDCSTCHNRVSHEFKTPQTSMDNYMSLGLIDPKIPEIHKQGVASLSGQYATQQEGLDSIAKLDAFYKENYADFYQANTDKIQNAIKSIQEIYTKSVFLDQKVNWDTHPDNLGHMDSPGCFRCHDGKHVNSEQEAIPLECNLCHSIPVVSESQDFVTKIEISRGPEPESHLNSNWISLHNQAFDATCANCHTTEGAGTIANNTFCSNSACHGNTYTYAGFDAPKMREILQAQLPKATPAPTPAPVVGAPTYDANISAILSARCVMCHGAAASGGLNLSTYADLMKGGKDGVVVTPRDSANSLLVKIQSAKHFANVTDIDLALIKQWIDAGAAEK
jgi:hypothetical protein